MELQNQKRIVEALDSLLGHPCWDILWMRKAEESKRLGMPMPASLEHGSSLCSSMIGPGTHNIVIVTVFTCNVGRGAQKIVIVIVFTCNVGRGAQNIVIVAGSSMVGRGTCNIEFCTPMGTTQ